MKHFAKILSLILVLVLLVNMLPMSIFAEQLQDDVVAELSPAKPDASVSILHEITQKRTQYTKEFLLSNGLHLAVAYPEPVHYEKDGAWEAIDNTLTAKTDGTYINSAGRWQVAFPQQFGKNQTITVTKDGYTLSFGMPQRLTNAGTSLMSASADSVAEIQAESATAQIQTAVDVTAEKEKAEYPETVLENQASRLTYNNIHSGTDVVYDLTGEKVKESVVMKSYDSTLRGFRYTLNVGSMVPVLADEGHITFYDETQTNVIMVMPAPYMVDAAMEMSMDVGVTLTGSGSVYTLTYTLPTDWLASGDRQWPVILDPVIQASLQTSNIRDASVAESKTFGYTSPVLETGYYAGEGKQRTYLKYQSLPSLTSADMVVAATVTLYKFVTSDSTAPIEVHKVLGSWESESLTWSNKPACDTSVEDFVICKEARYYNWDVTDIVRQWYATGNNYGMMFKASDAVENGGANNFKQFYSSDYSDYPTYKPALTIMFRNSNGLESYWDYTSASAGRAGTGYVNNYTGNLVWTHSDMGFPGNRMPVSISHIYNANDAASNSFGMGYGWRTNYNQRVYRWSANSNYYVWEDSDGTKHYFLYESSGAYKDEDGLSLTLTNTGSGNSTYVITDKYGNTSHFNASGYLTKLQNNQATKSAITITYKSAAANLINTITDGAGRVYSFSYVDYLLDRISFKGTGSTELTYTTYTYTSSNLTKITDKDGKYATYAYNSGHILSSATDVDGYKLSYTYTLSSGTFAPCRVASVREYDGSVSGGHLTFAYANNQTTVSDQVNGTKLIYQFNNWGNTVSVQDDEGRAQFMEFDRDVWSDNTGKGNQLNLSSKLQATVVNILQDSSFENGTMWTLLSSAPSMGYGITGDAAYIGQKSIYVSGGYGEILHSQTFTIEPGETYTFSGYLKTTAGRGQLGIMNAADSTDVRYTDQVSTSGNWQRFETSYINTSASSKQVYAVFRGTKNATVYLDCVQVEKAATASRYNLVQNGDFRSGNSGWSGNGLESGDGVATTATANFNMDGCSYKINANPTAAKYIHHTIPVSGLAGDSFVFSGWAKGNSASLANLDSSAEKEFALMLTFQYTDGSTKSETISFNPDVNNWQYVAASAVAEKAYSSVTLKAVYSKNANTVYFDGFQLYKEEFGNTYTYDSNGNVISVKDLQKKVTTYEYTNNNLTKILENNAAKMTYTYDGYHNVKTATSQEGVKYAFEYDTYGNNTKVSITNGSKTISASAAYTASGNLLASTTDALDKTTTYSYNENTGLVTSVKYPKDTDSTRTNYTYDSMYRTATAVCTNSTGQAMSASYGYTDDNLTSVVTPTATYTFTYGNFSLRSDVKIGGNTLVSYSYASGSNRLNKLTYGNGDYIQYTYDSQGRVIKETYEDGQSVTYAYNRNGNLARTVDSETGISTTYYYDSINRPSGHRAYAPGSDHIVQFAYDKNNNVTYMTEITNDVPKYFSYTYDNDNRITSMNADGITVNYTYDSLGRLTRQMTKNGNTVILTKNTAYATSPSGKATAQVSSYNGFTYTYDDNGNIISVSDGTNTTSYVYDSQNQLIRENNGQLQKSYTWTYDASGNITSRKEYAYTTGTLGTATATHNYAYTASKWGDLLRTHDGKTITYDGVGNPMSYDGWTFNWKHGRQLASMSKGSTTWTYTYGANGMRTSRSNGTTTYQYYYTGDQLTVMTKGSTKLSFTHDAAGNPLTLTYNGTKYYYNTNLQGDVIGILDSSGATVVTYIYDAWGRIRSTTGTLASTLGADNPLRYRGYVYDSETLFYYLQSRYYNPEWGRFINADAFMSDVGGDIRGNNMFAYCFNNPVNMSDETGTWPEWFETSVKIVSAVVVVAAVVVMATTVGGVAGGVIAATSAAKAMLGASVFLGASLSGINGGIANEAKGNSYANGYVGGLISGGTQSAASRFPGGTVWGGVLGTSTGTAVTMGLNNIDPYSANATAFEIATEVKNSALKATATSMITAAVGAGVGGMDYKTNTLYGGVADGCGGLMPSLTLGFGEGIKAFFGAVDDAIVYIWE